MASKKVVHIVGTGTIGEPLIGLFAEKKTALGFDEVTFHKRTPLMTDRSKVTNLIKRGAHLACDESSRKGFRDIGIEVVENYERMGADEIMPIFQAGPATDAEVKNSLRLFGKYVIPHFKTKERQSQTIAAAAAAHSS